MKDIPRLEAAYNDSQGVTAEFNRNVLSVLNTELNADFDLEQFEHVARYDARQGWIEMLLRSTQQQTVTVADLDLRVQFGAGELLRTEISAKFTPPQIDREIEAAGMRTETRWTDRGRRLRGDPRRQGLRASVSPRRRARRRRGRCARWHRASPAMRPRSEAQSSVSVPSAVADRKTSWSGPPSAGSATTSRTATKPGSSIAWVRRTRQRRSPSVNPLRSVSGVGIPTPLLISARSTTCPGDSETRRVPSPPVTTDQPDGTWSSPDGRATATPPSSRTATGCGVRVQPPSAPAATAQQISAPRRLGTDSPLR